MPAALHVLFVLLGIAATVFGATQLLNFRGVVTRRVARTRAKLELMHQASGRLGAAPVPFMCSEGYLRTLGGILVLIGPVLVLAGVMLLLR